MDIETNLNLETSLLLWKTTNHVGNKISFPDLELCFQINFVSKLCFQVNYYQLKICQAHKIPPIQNLRYIINQFSADLDAPSVEPWQNEYHLTKDTTVNWQYCTLRLSRSIWAVHRRWPGLLGRLAFILINYLYFQHLKSYLLGKLLGTAKTRAIPDVGWTLSTPWTPRTSPSQNP